jgi:hypothetical protein
MRSRLKHFTRLRASGAAGAEPTAPRNTCHACRSQVGSQARVSSHVARGKWARSADSSARQRVTQTVSWAGASSAARHDAKRSWSQRSRAASARFDQACPEPMSAGRRPSWRAARTSPGEPGEPSAPLPRAAADLLGGVPSSPSGRRLNRPLESCTVIVRSGSSTWGRMRTEAHGPAPNASGTIAV